MMRVALLGAGHIAGALAEGWSLPEISEDDRPRLFAYDPAAARAQHLCRFGAVSAVDAPAAAVEAADVVLLAMRPPDVLAALSSIAASVGTRAVVSVAAFITVEDLCAALPGGARVGRVMPSVGAAVGRAAFPMVTGTLMAASGEVAELFGLLGPVVPVPEDLFDVATAVASCGPGFAAYVVDALASGGEGLGLDATTACRLAAAALEGAAGLVARGDDPEVVWRAVAVPGGMTARGIEALQEGGVREALMAAVNAAVARAREPR
jgi:pyrroline-5-carboxylate reductase